jgi:predicted transcriptional regulator
MQSWVQRQKTLWASGNLAARDQDELAEYAREIEARRTGVYKMTDDERVAVKEGLAEARAGKFATDEQIAAIFRKARSPRRWRFGTRLLRGANLVMALIIFSEYAPQVARDFADSIEAAIAEHLRYPYSAQETELPGVRRKYVPRFGTRFSTQWMRRRMNSPIAPQGSQMMFL